MPLVSAAKLRRSSPLSAVVSILSATDPDSPESFAFSLPIHKFYPDNASFIIEGDTLRAAHGFDYEMDSTYSILLRVFDSGGLFFSKALTIHVTNVNETPTDLSLWRQLSGKNFSSSDFNGDGTVDLTDLTILAGYWQTPVPAAISSTSAEEPESNSPAPAAADVEDDNVPLITADECSSSAPAQVDLGKVEPCPTAITPSLPKVEAVNGNAEVISGGAGNDIVVPAAAVDATFESAGEDPIVEAKATSDATLSEDGNNTILGQASDDQMYNETSDVIHQEGSLTDFSHSSYDDAATWRNSLYTVLGSERDLLGARVLSV